MIDTQQVKALLTSNDIDALQGGLDEIAKNESLYSESSAQTQEQLLKLQILLVSRILALQQQASADKKDLVLTYRKMAILWMRSGETEKSLGQVQKALDLGDGKDPETLELMARAHLNLSQYDAAIEAQEKTIAYWQETADSTDRAVSAHGQLATIYEARGEFQQAISILEKASGMADGASELVQADIYGKLGIISEKIGQDEQAKASLAKAHELYLKTKGESYYKTQEIAYLLEMASDS
mmetsp:Transcript_10867/g.30045  ORF Transcript_10867/g.30045 Transcript_10867/m.30045 type:complete len:240 (+) Transcript_10867:1344-2063(+)